jgi:hypothetical protein
MTLGATCVGVMQLRCRVSLRSCANRRCRCTHINTRQKTTWGQAEALKGTCECVSLFNSGTHVCTHMGPCVRRPWCGQVQAHAHQGLCLCGLAPVFEKRDGFFSSLCCFLQFLCDFSAAAQHITWSTKGAQSSTSVMYGGQKGQLYGVMLAARRRRRPKIFGGFSRVNITEGSNSLSR